MTLWASLRVYGRLMRRLRTRRMPEQYRILRRRPAILAGVSAYELGLLASNRLDGRLKGLASIKTAALIGCVF
jgi:hypothetical protein